MSSISLSDANKERTSITNEELEQIQKMYKQLVKQVSQQSKDLSTDESASASLKRLQLNDLKKDLNRAIRELGTQLEQNISSDMDKAASAVCDDMNKWHDKIGLKLEGALANVPTQIVQMVSSGKLYEGNWSLSSAIWKDVQKTQGDINSIIAQGIALNKSAYDIARDLEKYVDPSARKDWDWGKVYPGTKKVVDYNAQRLARTMVSHAYQQSLISTCAKNPFVEGFIWHSAHSSRVCPICQERDGKTFPKNDLPLDHPNGMCTYEPATDDLMSISNRLADWVKGKEDPELDKWASDLMGVSHPGKRGTKDEAITEGVKWASRITEEERAALKEYTGTSYSGVNSYLRGDDRFDTSDVKRIADGVHSALKKTELPSDLTVFRGSTIDGLQGLIPDFSHRQSWLEKGKNLDSLVGTDLISKSFMSTSLDAPLAQYISGVKYEIELPKGSNAGYMGGISIQGNEEREVLIDKDTTFTVSDIQYDTDEDGYVTGVITVFLKLKN